MVRRALVLLAAVLAANSAGAAPCPSDLPVLFLVQDKSGTMKDSPDPACTGCDSKWSMSRSAVGSLTSTFSNRFRFGLELFPHDTTTFNCTTGTTVSPVGSSTDTINAAYTATAPGGGTPTAVSLDAARSYLTGLHLAEPAYVLLITDGLPNCDLSLDPTSCTATTPGCANDACGLGSKDCLDDSATRAAARALYNAGIKVYVVGFGASATSSNNLAVLDGIAAAGGTTRSIAANDLASLNAALSQVAFDATTCCKDVCTSGASQCTADGQVKTCRMDTAVGCTNWFVTDCPTKSACIGGSCQSCTDECTPGAGRCDGDLAQKCVVGPSGCAVWEDQQTCGWGEVCSGGNCSSCGACSMGDSRCTATGVDNCVLDIFSGCTSWESEVCPSGSICTNGSCGSCSTTCTAGQRTCQGNTVAVCQADANGCTRWVQGEACSNFCSGGSCGTCGTTCTPGQTRCNGSTVETCAWDANGCTVWKPGETCASGDEFCSNGQCYACGMKCTSGSRRCNSNTVEECIPLLTGCNGWAPVTTCGANETCQDGVCAGTCQDECRIGEGRCDAIGRPQTCERAPTGCTVWKSGAACAEATLCVTGICRDLCNGGELETCPDGYVCTGLPEGRVCLPTDATQSSADGGLPVDPNAGNGGTGAGNGAPAVAPSAACGCNAAATPTVAPLALLALGLIARRRRS